MRNSQGGYHWIRDTAHISRRADGSPISSDGIIILIDEQYRGEEANKAKSTFLFNMSYDIRTPMNAILGYSELSARNPDVPEMLERAG